MLAHYNWHSKASVDKSGGITEPSINLKRLTDMLNRRIERMFDICNQATHILLVYYDKQGYSYMSIDDEIFQLSDYENLRSIFESKFGKNVRLVNLNDVNEPVELIKSLD